MLNGQKYRIQQSMSMKFDMSELTGFKREVKTGPPATFTHLMDLIISGNNDHTTQTSEVVILSKYVPNQEIIQFYT